VSCAETGQYKQAVEVRHCANMMPSQDAKSGRPSLHVPKTRTSG
jgi:hypothetical protein